MNKQAELTRWTPKRLLSLLMALIMTLSLLPTAALAASDYNLTVTGFSTGHLIVGQESNEITANLTADSSVSGQENVWLKITVKQRTPAGSISTGDCTIQYKDATSTTYTDVTTSPDYIADTITGYLGGTVASTLTPGGTVSATFKLKFNKPGQYDYSVIAYHRDASGNFVALPSASAGSSIVVKDVIESVTVDPANPEAGKPFTVTAITNVAGNIDFSYGAQYGTVSASPRADGTYYANIQFTADNTVPSTDAITATLFDTTGILATKNADLTVATAATYHTVVFRANGDNVYTLPAPQTVKSGEKAAEPVAPERKGYTFDGWYDSAGTKYDFTTAVTGNLELYAKWTAKKITVNFENLSATEGVTILPDVTSTQFSVDSVAHFSVKVPDKYNTSDLLVWIGETLAAQTYLVPVERVEGTDHTTGKPFVTLYYQFTVTDDMANPTKVVIGPVTAKTFTVMMPTGHFTAQITSVSGTAQAAGTTFANVEHGGSYTFTVTPDKGYTVKRVAVNGATIGQNSDGSYTVPNVTTAQTVEVVVDELPVYIVIYNSNNSQYAFQRVTAGSKATLPADPVVEGYTFGGWYTDQNGAGTQFTTSTDITGDITVYAKLTPKTYQISYNANTTDAVMNMPTANQLKTHGLAVQLDTAKPTREGYTFLGWGTTENATAASYQPGDMYSADKDITLYAVWQKQTFNISLSSGTGYSIHHTQPLQVEYGDTFSFRVAMSKGYSQTAPSVWMNWVDAAGTEHSHQLTNPTETTDGTSGLAVYHYTTPEIYWNATINVVSAADLVYTVTYKYAGLDGRTEYPKNDDTYLTQNVSWNEAAAQPAAPSVDGYKFVGWYKDAGLTMPWNFATDKVTGPTTIYAKLTAIEPVITWPTTTPGYEFEFTAPTALVGNMTGTGKVDYGSTVTFTIKILEGYDASKMQVGINGQLLAPKSKSEDGKTYTFEFTAKENTNITVVGVERKTVTIIYNANARDDVSGMPEAQTVKYYLDTATAVNDKIINQTPVRTGYDFLGWSIHSDATAADTGYDAATIKSATGATAKFTENTTLYAVWKAVDTTVSLKVTDVAATDTTTPATTRYLQYEGEKITLQATLNFFAKGTVVFYKGDATGATGEQLGSTSINGRTAELSVTVGQYKSADKDEYYWVKFEPEADEGYAGSTSAVANVGILSKAICWSTDTDASELLVYKGNSATGTLITDAMIAGQTYTLKVKTDKITGVETLDSKKPVLGQDYKIVWQYYEVDKNDWKTVSESSDTATYLVTGEYSGYQFRAQIVPLGKDHDSLYLKAAKYTTGGVLEKDQYDVCLYTKPTAATTRQATATALEITGADDEAANVTINGNTPFTTTGEHKAQFEGKKVTLTATVTDTTANAGVKSGEVKFYRYVDGTNDELLNTTLISVDSNGVATCEVTISNWDTTKGVTGNKDEFYAVYLANATYDTSASWTATTAGSTATGELKAVYIKSTTIQTPIIDSTLPGKLNGADANSTSYEHDLTGLLAGVKHTFTLRQTGAAGVSGQTDDWSVVALDGRTVAAKNYDIEWQYKTNGNFAKADNDSTAAIYTTKTTKFGDQYRVVLNPKGDMKIGATSKVAEIGKKQDVTVTVEASADWVYQLNEITLTATVAAKETSSTMKPTGTVTFYYSVDNGTTWTKIGDTKDLAEVAGVMTASIKTDQLPVKAGDNTKQNVEITAVYEGNETFEKSATATATGASHTIAATPNCTTTNKDVTVYSSVVYVDSAENTTNTPGTHEIAITTEGGKVLANETNVNLKLSEVYTLDHATDAADKALLAYGTDYTVQWQMLSNAAAYPDKAAKDTPWTNIDSATGTTCQIDVEQGAAYRAVITVKDTPIAKGSFTEVQQAIPGHKVYYSNILVAANAPATLTVNVNTDNTSKGYEGIVEGETVTIHTFTSGATGTTPISQLTVNIYPGKPAEVAAATTPVAPVFTAEKANVNGHVSFDWNKDVTPGYYTLKVKATFTNGYDDKEITRTLIVRDNDYKFELSGDNAVYNGKVQGLNVAVQNMGIENALAQKSVVVYYYDTDGKMVEPTQAGTYKVVVRLQESAYWTEKTLETTFTIKPRPVEVVDLVAQAKVYDGTINANIQEIILNDASTDQTTTGLPTDGKGIIDGDSVYAVGTGYTSQATAGTADLGVKNVTLMGDDAANYVLDKSDYTEDFNIQRSQVKGAIVSGRTYKYTGKDIKLAASDIYLIDQAGSQLTDYDVTYYYHNGDGVEQVSAMNKMGKYTVIARPEQDNYKGGATETVYVGTTDNAGTLDKSAVSSLITISNTVELYGATTRVTVSATKGTATARYYYNNGTSADWHTDVPTNAGRYLVKATVTNDGVTDTAYGIYTIVKARPEFTPTTNKASMEYTSGRYDGAIGAGFVSGKSNDTAETYITYTGGTIQGVAYEAPTEVGKYIATVHVGETANYTAHEKQVAFEITPKALTITADDISRQQYGAYPDLTASFKGLATGGVAADTSLRDVQIQPELIDKSNYTNDASDQVGNNYKIIAVAALARNYTVSYVDGNMSVTSEDPKPYLEIRGMIKNGDNATDLAYYGDVIQLYAYGNQSKTTGVYNTSSVLAWSVTGPATITDGLLTVTGVGDVTVTLKRGIGAQQISTSLTFEAKKQEVKVVVPAEDKVYDGTVQDYTSTKKLSAVNAMGTKVFTENTRFVIANKTRSDVGSQIVTGKVSDSIHSFQSETYGGLFTINVKDVTVTPNEISVTYGDTLGTLGYTPIDIVSGVPALTDGKAVSEREDYKNLDVLDGYEILVAGRENENYNVKYVTDQAAPDVEVTVKTLTIKTGTLNSDGRTSGYLKDNDQFYMNEGFAITGTTFNLLPNDRMYGEFNPVMDYTFAGFVSGDSEADLVTLLPWLVKYSDGTYHNINGNANVAFDKTNHLNGFRATSFMSGMSAYPIDSMLLANSVKNYTLASTEATQNIYQRPVTLKLREGLTKLTAYKPEILGSSGSVTTEGKAKLLELLLNNLVVDKYNGEGGLAELLKHTIEDLNIQIDTISVSAGKLTLTLKLGNQNYWLDSASSTIEIELVSTKIVPVYSPLDWTSFTVTMYNETKTTPVAISGNVRFFIFQKKDGVELKYSNYKNDTIIRSGLMDPTGRTGEFRATFSRLPAGDYAIFAIAENYTIVE